ncbi:MAG: RIP metalloprotease RseP [Bacteroidia bacterium]
MGNIIMISQLIFALAILITFHEWGHFQTARWFGIKVEKFYLFFDAWGKKLFKFKKGDTEYGIGWLPLGGYVKISGMIDESMDKEFLNKDPEPWEFRSKPAWQRLIVMIGGVTVNVILGIALFTIIALTWGVSYLPIENLKNGIVTYEYGEECGFQNGDHIVAVNGQEVARWSDVINTDLILGDEIVYTVEREGVSLDLTMPEDFANRLVEKRGEGIKNFISFRSRAIIGDNSKAEEIEDFESKAAEIGVENGDEILKVAGKEAKYYDQFVGLLKENSGNDIELVVNRNGAEVALNAAVSEKGKIGVIMAPDPFLKWEREFFSFGGSFSYGVETAFGSVTETIKAFGKIFSGKLDPTESLSGPFQIATIFGTTWIWEQFWTLTARLSMILAFMNILPIPALDGGHVFFLLIEMVRGKPLSDKALERAQLVGFVILVVLMVFIFGNDIYQLFIR